MLFLHGWSDYFFNEELAEFWTGQGFAFFALDMHNHGRSLHAGTHGGYVADLDDYDAEITAAIGIIAAPAPRGRSPADGGADGAFHRRADCRAVGQPASRGWSRS